MTSSEEILAGRYQIIKPLGGGGFGRTFLAKDLQLPNTPTCVVKQLKPQFSKPQELAIAKRLFDSEAKTLHDLGNHDQIPRLFAHFEQKGEFYLVQEFIEGHTLDKEIGNGRKWSQLELVTALIDILQVLAFVHSSQVIHRDIKPTNLMRRHSDRKIVLIDFGTVKALNSDVLENLQEANNETRTVVVGSLVYMPSEQMAGQPKFCSDIYALGMMCLQALTGLGLKELPKDEQTKEYSVPLACGLANVKINSGLAAIISKMVFYDYRQRYLDAKETLQDLAKLLKNSNAVTTLTLKSTSPSPFELEEPAGQIEIGSRFYIQRPPIEKDCGETILRAGALIRIKAPREMGKSSLLTRTLAYGKYKGYKVAHLYFQQADSDVFGELDIFLQWFCASIAAELNLEDNLEEYWQGVLGSKNKCTKYFQRYLLSVTDVPLVLGLDEVDLIFQYPKIASDFFGLLRAWHEKAKNEEIWKKLRLVIVHSKEVYIPLNINQSPFNVGLPIELPELTLNQLADLIKRHQLDWQASHIHQLMLLTGGHPYLARQALYQIARGRTNLVELIQQATTEDGIYGNHLRRQLVNLQEDPEMLAAFRELVSSDRPLHLDSRIAFKLRSIGMVKFQGNLVIPMCDLYRLYFRQSLRIE
ncbi:AAA-like domain-containing protein [Pseudanabaena sp. FACHB-1998]|uniref:AAA-like domain-containing protein n=1 Tax=Pseudanabaena sp. FACHB-1998 TaxID=2692858 RepID=UPI0016812BDB|nr:AAA-like domain-containing protein [Pseudanabaena sp. FACHB-1998]MBD2179204.1 AAA-like domain-containing protein [Pseudanabaena sp. FACHB-1998]